MTAYDDDAALMADLMRGRLGRIDTSTKLSADERKQLDEAIDHLRAQIISQTDELREWRRRHGALIRTKVARHYSAYEGLFARHHLRLYWILYRGAMHAKFAGCEKKPRLWAV